MKKLNYSKVTSSTNLGKKWDFLIDAIGEDEMLNEILNILDDSQLEDIINTVSRHYGYEGEMKNLVKITGTTKLLKPEQLEYLDEWEEEEYIEEVIYEFLTPELEKRGLFSEPVGSGIMGYDEWYTNDYELVAKINYKEEIEDVAQLVIKSNGYRRELRKLIKTYVDEKLNSNKN